MPRITAILSGIVFSLLLTAPVLAAPAAGPVTCTDGTTASHGGKGACSKHGGVKKSDIATEKPAKETKKGKRKKQAIEPEKPAATTPASAGTAATTTPSTTTSAQSATGKSTSGKKTDPNGAIARCKDGTYSHAKTHHGACSRHGGAAEWLDGSGKH